MVEFLFNPWVITIIIVAILVGNLAALKYSAKVTFDAHSKNGNKQDLDKLIQLDKKHQNQLNQDKKKEAKP